MGTNGGLHFSDLARIKRSETEVYRGNERTPLLLIRSPAAGAFNARGTDRVVQVSRSRGLGTDRPNRFDIHYSAAAQAIMAVPMLVNEETEDEDLFEVKWPDSVTLANVNLIELLQPRNMAVPRGQVMEVPVRVQSVPELGGDCLVIDLSQPVYRNIREERTAESAAAAQG